MKKKASMWKGEHVELLDYIAFTKNSPTYCFFKHALRHGCQTRCHVMYCYVFYLCGAGVGVAWPVCDASDL